MGGARGGWGSGSVGAEAVLWTGVRTASYETGTCVWPGPFCSWSRAGIHNGVIAIFQRKGLPDQELFSLNEGVRQLLKTELGSFLTEYLQVGGPSPPAGRGGFPRPGGPGSPALGGYVEPRVPRTLPPHDSVSPSVQRGSS
uniref:Uncharacterized protein n=1 Tax=Suricata suricatta TaxID=37032 RepID=A0A673UA63_SURSU